MYVTSGRSWELGVGSVPFCGFRRFGVGKPRSWSWAFHPIPLRLNGGPPPTPTPIETRNVFFLGGDVFIQMSRLGSTGFRV